MTRRQSNAVGRVLALSAFCVSLPCCNNTTLPPPSCPTSYIQQIPLAVAPQSATTSVNLSLSASYMRNRIAGIVQSPETDAQGNATSSGADVKSINLVEKIANGQPLRLVNISLEPWIRGQNGGHTSLNNRYDLFLKLTPYIVNKTTVTDAAQRKTFLCGTDPQCTTDEGVLLGFELYELDNRSQGTVVSTGNGVCGTINQVDQRVLESLWGSDGALTKARPVVLPTASITQLIGTITGATATTTGVALGSDGDLKVGLLMDQGTPRPFDSTTGFRPEVDWSIDIDSTFISNAISVTASTSASQNNPPATITSTSVTFTDQPENDIDATVEATLPICGTARARTRAHIRFDVCNDTSGQPILQMCRAEKQELPNNWFVNGCVAVDYALFRWPKIGVAGDPPCGMAGSQTVLKFAVAPSETFYATAIDISNIVFHIDGRSTVMDSAKAAAGSPRPTAPMSCNTNFSYQFP